MVSPMLEFAECVMNEIRLLRNDAERHILDGSVKSMEQYRHLMGRLEGYTFVEQAVRQLLHKNPNL
jgi:hypothetical protein